jgi:sugar phosphate isomerase/epimerase
MLGDMYLCASMVEEASLDERLDAAAAAGYHGIGLRPAHLKAARASGLDDSEIRALLEASGLELVEVGFVADWWEGGDKGERSVAYERVLHGMADAFGARHLMVISGPATEPLDFLAERFAGVCDRAAEHGLRVGLECLPWTGIPDVGSGWRVVERAGRDNGGIVLDTWHLRRGGSTEEMVRAIPAERVVAIQISDGRYDVVAGHLDDTFRRRELPGDGEFDLGGFVRLVEGLGVSAPVGVEVLSDRMRERSVAERARLGRDATARVLEAARAQRG